MPTTVAKPKSASARAGRFNSASSETWKLEDAKARLSEVVRRAGTNGPQLVTIRGKEAAVILAPDEYRKLLPKPKGQVPLNKFLRGLHLDQLDLTREYDTGREIDLL
jgi:prevent-host-death family protein